MTAGIHTQARTCIYTCMPMHMLMLNASGSPGPAARPPHLSTPPTPMRPPARPCPTRTTQQPHMSSHPAHQTPLCMPAGAVAGTPMCPDTPLPSTTGSVSNSARSSIRGAPGSLEDAAACHAEPTVLPNELGHGSQVAGGETTICAEQRIRQLATGGIIPGRRCAFQLRLAFIVIVTYADAYLPISPPQ